MKSRINLFFEAIEKNDIKSISNDWIMVLNEIFPNAVLYYDGFLVLKDYYDRLNDFFSNKSILTLQYLINSPFYSWINNETQKFAANKIYIMLPEIIEYLNSAFNNFGVFSREIIPLEQRIINKKIISFKWWLDVYYSPYKLLEEINSKTKLSSSDYEIIARLNINKFNSNLVRTINSKEKTKKQKEIALKTLLHLKDKKIDDILKKMTEDITLEDDIRVSVIENLLVRKVDDKDFWFKLYEISLDDNLKSKIDFKIKSLDNKIEELVNLLKNTNLKDSIIILKLIENSNPNVSLLKNIFKYIFDERVDVIESSFTKENKKQFVVSDTALSIFLNFFKEYPRFIQSFSKVFVKYLIKVKKIDNEIFNNFINLLFQIMNKEEIEILINLAVNEIEQVDKKFSFIYDLQKFFPIYKLNYNPKVDKVWFLKN